MNLIFTSTLHDNGLAFLRHAWQIPESFAAILKVSEEDYKILLLQGVPALAHQIFKYHFESRQAFIIAIRDYGFEQGKRLLMAYVCEYGELETYSNQRLIYSEAKLID